MNKETLKNYAELIVRSGVNLAPGQEAFIEADLEIADFALLVAEECYKAGAARVHMDWSSQYLFRLEAQYQSLETLSEVPLWEEDKLRHYAEVLPARIVLKCESPDGLVGIDNAKMDAAQRARYKIINPYKFEMLNKQQWCVACVPGKAWAKKVFPELSVDDAVEKLWEMILKCARADGPNPHEEWRKHDDEMAIRADWLNSLNLRRLVYRSESSGTDFNIGLIPHSLFGSVYKKACGGNRMFNANIPSEEIANTPMRGDAEGIVYSTLPLSYRGALIENFSIRFENGRAVEAKAEKNEDLLKSMIATDEGSCMLGECALVPWSSPIRESGIIFYNTLFDENAACHLALGFGFTDCLENGENISREEARKIGINESMIHVDFMIGAPDLNVWGINDKGEKIQIFRNGTWAVDL